MNASPRSPRPPDRRPFSEPTASKPFLRSPEFQRIVWFSTLLLFVGAFATYTLLRDKAAVDATTPAGTVAPVAARTAEDAVRRRGELSALFEGALLDSENATDFAETEGYHRLIRLVAAFTPEAVHERVQPTVDPAALLLQPDAYRGDFVQIRGVINHMTAEKLRAPVLGIHDVYRGFLGDGDGRPRAVFDLVDHPGTFDARRDPMDVEGVFFRTVRYETKKGEFIELPYLIARNITKVDSVPPHHSRFLRDHTAEIVIGIGLAILAARLLMYWMQRSKRRSGSPPRARPPDFRDLFEAKMREEARASGKPPKTPPA